MKKIIALFTFILSLFIISCSNAANDDLFVSNSNEKNITLYITSNSEVSFSNNSNRSIIPSALSSNQLDFYLEGTNKSTGTTLQRQKLTFEEHNNEKNTGSVTLSLQPGIYELTLFACQKGSELSGDTALLKAKTYTDLYVENSVFFTLTSQMNSSVAGTANFYIYTKGWQVTDDMNVTVGIYKLSNDDIVYYEKTNFPLKNYHYEFSDEVPEDFTCNFYNEPVSLNATTYNFKVTINTKGKDFYYTDTLFIEPNRTTLASVGIPPIVAKIPESPDYLIAQYKEPKDESEVFCPVKFCWTDNSVTESNFQLELLCIDDSIFSSNTARINLLLDSSVSTDSKNLNWNTLKTTIKNDNPNNSIILDNTFYEDEDISKYMEGALIANSKYCVYNFLTGKKYLARLCACSSAGNSEYVYLDLLNSGNHSFETSKNDANYKNWTSTENGIYIEPYSKTLTAEEKALQEKYAFVGGSNVLVFQGNTESLNVANQIALDSSFNSFTISQSTASNYLYFTLRNVFAKDEDNSGMGIYTSVFKDVSFAISEQGGLPFIEYEYPNPNGTPTGYDSLGKGAAEHAYLAVNIKDTTKFQAGKTYNVVYKAKAKTEDITSTATVIFTLTE